MAFEWLKRKPEVQSGALEEHHEEVESQGESVAPIKPSEAFAAQPRAYVEYKGPLPPLPTTRLLVPPASPYLEGDMQQLFVRVTNMEERIRNLERNLSSNTIRKPAIEDPNILRQLTQYGTEIAKLTSFMNAIKNRWPEANTPNKSFLGPRRDYGRS
jgi:hypothetical protein